MQLNPLLLTDLYKADHRSQYPQGTELVYSNFTARTAKRSNIDKKWHEDNVVFFGLQMALMELDMLFDSWFSEPLTNEYTNAINSALGEGAITFDHITALHSLGYLPIEVRALPEGTRAPIGCPLFTIHNTLPEFFWLTNYLETYLSMMVWKSCTSATTADAYRRLLTKYAIDTGGAVEFVPFQAHDFSMRGMAGLSDCLMSGAAHLTSFLGSDSLMAIEYIRRVYPTNELIGVSVPATEHSVMCMGTQGGEIDTFRRLITEVYPAGIVSIVSDTWDYWKVITEYLPALQAEIEARHGKVVIRPDSGDPVKIICGDPEAEIGTPEFKGTVECLWEIFGGTTNEKGFKELAGYIGTIYGDSITLDRADRILGLLAEKGFCSTNVVFGVGSYTYEYVTRDTYGFAMKATYGVVNGEPRNISKAPKTDTGEKKSASGILYVNEDLTVKQNHDNLEDTGMLKVVFRNGAFPNGLLALQHVRDTVRAQ